MARVEVLCETCAPSEDRPVVAASLEILDHGLLSALLSRVHAGGPHAGPHKLSLRVDGERFGLDNVAPAASATPVVADPSPFWRESVTVEIECQHNGCQGPGNNSRRRWYVPRWFAPSVPILHHAPHEGHAFRCWIDGVEISAIA